MADLIVIEGGKDKGKDKARILTPKQEAFLRAMIESDDITLSDAYRSAYRTKDMSSATIHSRAYEVFHQGAGGEIAVRYKEAMDKKREHSLHLRGRRLDYILEGLQREAEGDGADTSASSRVRALELLGKVSLGEGEGSVFEDRVAHADQRNSDDLRVELEERLRRLLGAAPDQAG
jgi:hypothetical protein